MKPWPDEIDEMLATAKAMAERLERIVGALDAMGAEFDLIGWSAYDSCDCGHRRNVHRSARHGNGLTTCLIDGCGCDGFSDVHVRADAWRERELVKGRAARQDQLAAKRAKKGGEAA